MIMMMMTAQIATSHGPILVCKIVFLPYFQKVESNGLRIIELIAIVTSMNANTVSRDQILIHDLNLINNILISHTDLDVLLRGSQR